MFYYNILNYFLFKTDNCEVDVVTRRFCQKCRLKKCFDIGMKKEWILSDEEKKLKRLKIEENKRKRRTKQISSTYANVPSPFAIDSGGHTSNSYLNGSSVQSNSSSNSYTPPALQSTASAANSSLMANSPTLVNNNLNGLNPIVYDSQINDSNMTNSVIMQSTQAFNNQLEKNNQPINYFTNYSTPDQFQQPEIVNQLVYSHYEQYKTNSDYDPLSSLNYGDNSTSPQYSSSFTSNNFGVNDHFFSDSTASPSTFNSSTPISSINSPLNALSIVSSNLQNEISNESNDNNEQLSIYSSNNVQQPQTHLQQQQTTQPNQHPITNQQTNNSNKVTPIIIRNRDIVINCLPDNLMIDEIFEQAVASKLRPPCSCKSSCTNSNESFSTKEMEIINELIYATNDAGCAMRFVENTYLILFF